jgi:hypothetical protein
MILTEKRDIESLEDLSQVEFEKLKLAEFLTFNPIHLA